MECRQKNVSVSRVSVARQRTAGQTGTIATVLNLNTKSHMPYVTEKAEEIWMCPAAASDNTHFESLPV
jgi:hypothetical protein